MKQHELFIHALLRDNPHITISDFSSGKNIDIHRIYRNDVLNFEGIPIKQLPSEIGILDNLQYLFLEQAQISTLPPGIGQLKNLVHLDLHGSSLEFLPPEIGQLCSLEHLSLSSTYLQTLPREIGTLQALNFLSLSFTRNLTSVPQEISLLRKLEALYFRESAITYVPNVQQLTRLRYFDAGESHLKELPVGLGSLSALQELVVEETPISFIPDEIGNLTNLEVLNLGCPNICKIPSTIGQLSKLKKLVLGGTALSSLPRELQKLTNLEELNIYNTPNLPIPDHIKAQRHHPKAILDYYFEHHP